MIWFIAFWALAVALAYHRVSLQTGTIGLGAVLVAYALFGDSFASFAFWLLVFVAVAVPLNVAALRQAWLTRPALDFFRSAWPSLPARERTLLQAGTVWWEGELLSGVPSWSRFTHIPAARLSHQQQAFLDGPVEAFCRLCNDWQITAVEYDLSAQAWSFLREHRFFGLAIPEEHGGLGFSAQARAAVLHKIASSPGGVTAAAIVAVPNALGPAELLLRYGTEAQKQHYLPRLARGEEIPCLALASPWAGADAASMPDKGVVCSGVWKGRETLGISLTFDKRYVTLAPIATVVALAFRLFDPERRLGGGVDAGITCALVPRDTPGLEIGKRHWPIGNPFPNGPVRGREVFVPLDAIIGGPDRAGQGWQMLVECSDSARSLWLPSAAAGGASLAAFASGAYARIRRQLGQPIGRFEGVQEALARIGGQAYACNALRQFAAAAVDAGQRSSIASAVVKLQTAAMAQDVWKHAMDIHAGKGVMLGPANGLASHYAGTALGAAAEGANLLTRSTAVFGQGWLRCHPWLLREIEVAHESDGTRSLQRFDPLLWSHAGHVLMAAARAFVQGLSLARFGDAPVRGDEAQQFRRVNRYCAALALLGDAALALHGSRLWQRESVCARLGDVLAQLFIVCAALKRFEDEGRRHEDRPLLDWVCAEAFWKTELALDATLRHLPLRPLAWLLRLLVFPLGRQARPPSDTVQFAVAGLLQRPNEARTRLTAGCFVPSDTGYPTGLLEEALNQVIATSEIDRRVQHAVRDRRISAIEPLEQILQAAELGLVTPKEAQALRTALNLTEEVCRVDEFEPQQMKAEPPPA